MKVLTYRAHNVMKLRDADLDIGSHHLVLIGGRNKQGKTSALKGLLMALCGRSGMEDWPDVPLAEGQDEGFVRVGLSGDDGELHEPIGLTVELIFTRKRNGVIDEKFRILDSAGEEAPEPRALLKRLYSMKAFDPLSFERLGKKDKKALLEKLLGLDFAAERAAWKTHYDHRTSVNRELGKARAALAAKKPHTGVTTDTETSTADLLEELERRQAANRHNREIRAAQKAIGDEIVRHDQEIAEIGRQVEDLLRKRLSVQRLRDTKAATAASEWPAFAAIVDQDEAAVRQQMKDADATNRKIRDNQAYDVARNEVAYLDVTVSGLSEKLKEIEAAQQQAIKAAPWPVPGLGMDSEGVTLNGLPIEQASKRERLLTSVEIGMALNPKLRLLVCENGANDLDAEGFEILEELLVDRDFQLIAEFVTRGDDDENRCAVIIEDGEAVNRDFKVDTLSTEPAENLLAHQAPEPPLEF